MSGNCLFRTSGIRGIVGQDLSVDFCQEVAQSIGTTLPLQTKDRTILPQSLHKTINNKTQIDNKNR